MEIIKSSVSDLLRFVMRSGDIDNSFYSREDRLQQGIAVHQRIQQDYGPDYQKEVTLEDTTEYKEILFQIRGRVDGLFISKDKVLLDEIKSTTRNMEELEDLDIHWAQVKCYGYFYAKKKSLKKVNCQLTYCHVETQEIKKITQEFKFQELEDFYLDLLERYLDFSKEIIEFSEIRKDSIEKLPFPFYNYRKGQRKMAVSIYNSIKSSKNILLEAPTGIGKTMSALFSAIKSIPEGITEKIFYATAKTTIREAAMDAVLLLVEKNLRVKVVSLTSKENICINDEVKCNPRDCPYAKGHFDRVNNCLVDMYKKEDLFFQDIIEYYAKEYQVCPFELQLDLSDYSDIIIGDYNYLFNPISYLRRIMDEQRGGLVLLVDEAHNLADRSLDMYSKTLEASQIIAMQKLFRFDPEGEETFRSLYQLSHEIQKTERAKTVEDRPSYKIVEELEILRRQLEIFLLEKKEDSRYNEVLEFYFEILQFLKILEYFNDSFKIVIEKREEDTYYHLICLDASRLIKSQIDKARSTVFFSATLKPLKFYSELFGLDDYYYGHLPSPFNPDHLAIGILPLSVRYKDRKLLMSVYQEIVKKFVDNNKNSIIFFPSYSFLYEILKGLDKNPSFHIQERNMNIKEREEFILRFQEEKGVKGFCVLGGSFAEGVDLAGEFLEEVCIFSVGLPGISIRKDLQREYYNKKGKDGFRYTSIYPGMNRISQSAGRVIRSNTDKGKILLVDNRFTQMPYISLLPDHWNQAKILNMVSLDSFLKGENYVNKKRV